MTGVKFEITIEDRIRSLVSKPNSFDPRCCDICMWGKSDVTVLSTTMCFGCANLIAAEIDRLQRLNGGDK